MACRWRILLALYGALNAAAYALLLPLWEGFDESQHDGYVQSLSTNLKFPVLGPATLSFEFTQEERTRRRQELDSIPAGEKDQPQPGKRNYEVNQSPLPYLGMALVDRLVSGAPLTTRVRWLRLLSSLVVVLLLWHAVLLLARQLSLADGYAGAVLFCYLAWAAIRAHETGSRATACCWGCCSPRRSWPAPGTFATTPRGCACAALGQEHRLHGALQLMDGQ